MSGAQGREMNSHPGGNGKRAHSMNRLLWIPLMALLTLAPWSSGADPALAYVRNLEKGTLSLLDGLCGNNGGNLFLADEDHN